MQYRLVAEEKEKRRLKDQRLKEQKKGSKKVAKKEKKNEEEETKEIEHKEGAEADIEENHIMEESEEAAPKSNQLPKLLPQEFLEQFAKDEKAEKKRVHLSAKDFERMAEEEELKEQHQKSKKRNLAQGKQVG